MDNTQKPYCFTVEGGSDGYTTSTPFYYIEYQGTVAVSLFALSYEDGKWVEPIGNQTGYQVGQFGENGTKLTVTMTVGGAMGDFSGTLLVMCFNAAVDFTQPLPIGQLSLPDSSYGEFNNMDGLITMPMLGITQCT